MESKIFTRALESVRAPVQHFIDTGIYDEGLLGETNWAVDISFAQVRRVARKVAAELKRPFIQMHEYLAYYEHEYYPQSNGSNRFNTVKRDTPRWVHTNVVVPKRKRLVDHITPLILASEGPEPPCLDMSTPTLWKFCIQDHQLYKAYQHAIMTDPDLRRARGLTS